MRLPVRAYVIRVTHIPTVRLVVVLQALIYAVATPAVTFLPIYMVSRHGPFNLGHAAAALLAGVILVVGGVSGMLLGGALADWLGARLAGGRVLAVALGFAATLPCYVVMLLTGNIWLFICAGTLAALTMNLQAGPISAAVQDATPPASRASAVAVTLLGGHVLGDVWAPTAVGALATALGERVNLALLAIGVPLLCVGAVAATLGARVYAQDIARAAHASVAEPAPR